MGSTLHLNILQNLSSNLSISNSFKHCIKTSHTFRTTSSRDQISFNNRRKIRAIGTVPERDQANEASQADDESEPPSVGFAFVSCEDINFVVSECKSIIFKQMLLPDGTPDVQLRSATGGQKLRDIMLDNDIDLYGPYARPLLNCAGGGTCGSCMVEVIEGKELLNPRTETEKELLKKKPKNWRLACQTTVGTPDSRGMVVIQQLPEWKAHEWTYEQVDPNVSE